ncbi:uncharacterized protein UV8b_03459 [Ustilaginoidea virens]|uniref:Uncharacterized protein n=1 Tax=Ustilaginoidea virens TaxID=1159556 RepID=A0A1B5KSZ6_USTVR|nr:uncharacterized protein UV8b_03459 [Ustilaginoidea virens]QUC19218.1 hypothetical protein UV8b_03459 [Ustilaginoidea virens]GAO13082.1 hypothetical protein UVI_02024440 [Ustilaginoidea virens]
MGGNLSSPVVQHTHKFVLGAPDARNDLILASIWASVFYACAMVFTTCVLVDRWKGPADKVRVGGGSVLVALLVSTAWPVVMAYLAATE